MKVNSYNSMEIPYFYRGRAISALYGSRTWHSFKNRKGGLFAYKVGYVPMGYEKRPDLIANEFFGSPRSWWFLLEVNNISDPFEGLSLGTRIRIPANGI
jgi:hypothetical protein